VNISSRCEYGCRAVVELAQSSGKPMLRTVDDIAARRGVPEKFLVHILLQLKRAGIVKSMRGAHGGYLLARPPEEITMLDIVRAVDGPVLSPLPTRDAGSEDLEPSWREIAAGIEDVLHGVTVRDVMERAKKAGMYYI
jgi:Rrf2 family protein